MDSINRLVNYLNGFDPLFKSPIQLTKQIQTDVHSIFSLKHMCYTIDSSLQIE